MVAKPGTNYRRGANDTCKTPLGPRSIALVQQTYPYPSKKCVCHLRLTAGLNFLRRIVNNTLSVGLDPSFPNTTV